MGVGGVQITDTPLISYYIETTHPEQRRSQALELDPVTSRGRLQRGGSLEVTQECVCQAHLGSKLILTMNQHLYLCPKETSSVRSQENFVTEILRNTEVLAAQIEHPATRCNREGSRHVPPPPPLVTVWHGHPGACHPMGKWQSSQWGQAVGTTCKPPLITLRNTWWRSW